MVLKDRNRNKCFILLINETSRKINLIKAKTEEGLIHYKKKSWLVQTDPLFYKNQAFYIVSDRQIPSFAIELEEDQEEKKINPRKEQYTTKAGEFSPTALKKVATSEFFKALMSPLYWTRADWIKALAVGFSAYIVLKWILISIFKVPLP